MWSLFSILSAFTQATYYAFVKKIARDFSPYVLGGGYFFVGLPALLLYIIIFGLPDNLSFDFYRACIATSILNVIALVFVMKGLREVDLSLSTPIIASTPLFALLTSYFIVGELPSFWGVLGVLIVVSGLVTMNLYGDKRGKKKIINKLGVLYLFIVAFLYSFSANYDKLTSVNSNPYFGSLSVISLIGIIMFIIAIARGEGKIYKDKKQLNKILIIGCVLIIASFVWFIALAQGFVSYSLAVKRFSAVIGVLYGYFLFNEKNITQRLIGAIIVSLGLVVIIFLS